MTFNKGKITSWDEAFQDTETTGAIAHDPAKVSIAAQSVPI
jgi:hypothetical protein